jgi:hypothetical protein
MAVFPLALWLRLMAIYYLALPLRLTAILIFSSPQCNDQYFLRLVVILPPHICVTVFFASWQFASQHVIYIQSLIAFK